MDPGESGICRRRVAGDGLAVGDGRGDADLAEHVGTREGAERLSELADPRGCVVSTEKKAEPCDHRWRTVPITDLLLGGLSVCEICGEVATPSSTEEGEGG